MTGDEARGRLLAFACDLMIRAAEKQADAMTLAMEAGKVEALVPMLADEGAIKLAEQLEDAENNEQELEVFSMVPGGDA